MNGANPADSATGITERQAADQIASLLTAEIGDTQAESEADGDDEDQQVEGDANADEDGEGSEAEADDESESAEEEDDDSEHTEEPGDDVAVTIGDEKVTLHELKRGFLRGADYTRKTQALADDRRKHEAEAGQVLEGLRAERAQFVQGIETLQELTKQYAPVEPDWAALYEQNPAEYAAQREMFRSFHDQQVVIEKARRDAVQQAQVEYQEELKKHVKEEAERLLEKMPEWKDKKVADAAKQKIKDFALANGFTEQELSALTDHRTFLVVHKAALWDELQATRKKLKPVQVKAGQPKVAKPGNASTAPNSRTSDATRAQQRLAKTGKVGDAKIAIEHLLGDNF